MWSVPLTGRRGASVQNKISPRAGIERVLAWRGKRTFHARDLLLGGTRKGAGMQFGPIGGVYHRGNNGGELVGVVLLGNKTIGV